jgi:hypothetical protein
MRSRKIFRQHTADYLNGFAGEKQADEGCHPGDDKAEGSSVKPIIENYYIFFLHVKKQCC